MDTPPTSGGNRSLPKDLKRVDLVRVQEVMAGLCSLLDGIVDYIEAELESKQEWLRAAAPPDWEWG